MTSLSYNWSRLGTLTVVLAFARSLRLPVAGAHVTPLEGGSPVGGHGDIFSGGSPWTVTCPLPDLLVLLVSLVHF